MVSEAFARILEEKRGRLNALFAEARLQNPGLDGDAVLEFVGTTVAPVVDAVREVAPERAGDVLEALYPLALDLLSKELVGSRARDRLIGEGWQTLYPALARQLAAQPGPVAGALSNALYNLSRTPGARGREWIAELRDAAPSCPDVATLLKVGQVLAWRAGLAHFRQGALAICGQLEPALARAALGVPADAPPAVDEVLRRLADDPWLDPAALAGPAGTAGLRIVARVGAFRGFGGLFVAPPLVSARDENLIVVDGDAAWLLTADVFGATFHRTVSADVLPGAKSSLGPFRLEQGMRIRLGGVSAVFAELEGISSTAAVGQTLAVTTTLSHAVYLVAVA